MEILILLVAVGFIVFATVRLKMHPIFSLVLAAIIAGFSFGMQPKALMDTIADGFGKTLGSIGLVIAFGTVIGAYLEKTGATNVLATSILKLVGLKHSPMALNLAGFVVSIPVYCDSGFVILSSLTSSLSKKSNIPKLVFAIALASGLYAAHVFVPPTPGPLAAAAILEADLGLVLILGLVVAIPVSLVGCYWGKIIGPKLQELEVDQLKTANLEQTKKTKTTSLKAFLPLVLPLVLIGLKSAAEYPTYPFGEGVVLNMLSLFGNPIIALLIGVLCCLPLARGIEKSKQSQWIIEALRSAGLIVLITGAGGAFGAVLRTVDMASMIPTAVNSVVGGLVTAFIIAALVKSAQGSSTVAIITTAAILAPLMENFGLVLVPQKALLVLAIGAGAMTVSHINDSYFWVVSQLSNMDLKNSLLGHTIATFFQGVTALVLIVVLSFLV